MAQLVRLFPYLLTCKLGVDNELSDMSPTVLDAAGKLGKILVGMNRALGEIPLTIKLRTGVKEGRNNAHKLMPRIGAEWNVAAMTVSFIYATPSACGILSQTQLHGRTRQQRYSKLADWEYIKECVQAVRAREADEDCS